MIGGNILLYLAATIALLIGASQAFYLNTDELSRLKQKNNADITSKLEFLFDDEFDNGEKAAAAERADSRIISPSLGGNGKLREFPGSFQVKLNANNKSHLLKFNKILRNPEENMQSIYTLRWAKSSSCTSSRMAKA